MSRQKSLIVKIIVVIIFGATAYLFVKNQNMTADSRVNQIFKMRDIYNTPVRHLNTDFVIINFWASWCPPCVEETPSMIRFVEKYSQYFTLVALSQDTLKKDIESFMNVFPAFKSSTITVIHDDSRNIARLFKVKLLPETYIYSIRQNKFYQISGSTDWDRSEIVNSLEKFFNIRF